MQDNTLKVTLKFLKDEDVASQRAHRKSGRIDLALAAAFVALIGGSLFSAIMAAIPIMSAIAIVWAVWPTIVALGAVWLDGLHHAHFNRRYRLVRSGQYGPVLDKLLSARAKLEKRKGLTDEERKSYLAKADGLIRVVWVEAHQLLGLLEDQPDEATDMANALVAELNDVGKAVAELETYVQS